MYLSYTSHVLGISGLVVTDLWVASRAAPLRSTVPGGPRCGGFRWPAACADVVFEVHDISLLQAASAGTCVNTCAGITRPGPSARAASASRVSVGSGRYRI